MIRGAGRRWSERVQAENSQCACCIAATFIRPALRAPRGTVGTGAEDCSFLSICFCIATVPERMSYDVKEITVKAGKRIKRTFANPDLRQHNILLVHPGKADDVAAKVLALGAQGFDKQWIPESADIIWASKLLDHSKDQVIEFTAPEKPGDYPYVCSFPGHHVVMRGVLKVK